MENSPLENKGKQVRRFWFDNLPTDDDRDAILKPAFEEAHPTDDHKRAVAKEFDQKKSK